MLKGIQVYLPPNKKNISLNHRFVYPKEKILVLFRLMSVYSERFYFRCILIFGSKNSFNASFTG